MKNFLAVMVVGWALVAAAPAATPAAVTPAPPAPTERPLGRDVETLVRELADDSFAVREQATREIWQLGEAALPALHKALTAADPEQVFRARELIRKIQLLITPETDANVIGLVERYGKASPNEKPGLFGKLAAQHAWRQMLKLYAAETQAAVRGKLQPAIQGIAVKAARERLVQGDAQAARELLELAPADAEGLLALAEFHRSHGTLAAELTRAQAIKGRQSDAWQLALQRTAGNLDAAKAAAKAAGETRIAAAMAALTGDPLPWLQDRQGEQQDNPVVAPYTVIVSKRWLGQKIHPAELEALNRLLAARNRAERMTAMNAAFLLGEVTAAEAALTKLSSLSAFHYFESLERIPAALTALGLDPAHPDFTTWVAKRLSKLPTDDIEDQHEPSESNEEIVALANFLEHRGLLDEALAAFTGPMTTLAEKDAPAFERMLGALFGTRDRQFAAPLLARNIGSAWAGQDQKRWEKLLTAAVGEDEQAAIWWEWLTELDPAASRTQRFDGMLALFGLGADPQHLRDTWLKLAWQAVAAAPAKDQPHLAARISTLCIMTGDVSNSLKAWDKLDANGRQEVFWGEHVLHLSAVDRWAEAAAVFLKQIELAATTDQEPSAQFHAYAAAALRQAGQPEQAAKHDQWVDQLALGDAAIAIKVGNGYAFGRDYHRAAQWWARAARQADPDSSEFAAALKLHAEVLLDDGQWQTTAAVSEVLSRIYLDSDYRESSPLPLMRQRLQTDMARALAQLPTDRQGALGLLGKCHQAFASDGSLADCFFPALRRVGLLKEHDAWFDASWKLIEKVIADYPQSDNTRNTAAWFAARSLRKLNEAEQHLTRALASNPNQSAYLDTMAEINFAKGQRQQALEWSRRAVNFLPDDPQLRRQQERFRSAPLPK